MVFRQAIVGPTTTSGLNTNMNTTINTNHNQHIATTKQWDTVRLTNGESWVMVELTTTSLLPSKRVDKLFSMRVLISYTKIIVSHCLVVAICWLWSVLIVVFILFFRPDVVVGPTIACLKTIWAICSSMRWTVSCLITAWIVWSWNFCCIMLCMIVRMSITLNTDHNNQHIAITKQWDTVRLTNGESWAMVELTTTSLLPSKRVDKLISMKVLISYTKIIR
jgi:hypothetical protein